MVQKVSNVSGDADVAPRRQAAWFNKNGNARPAQLGLFEEERADPLREAMEFRREIK